MIPQTTEERTAEYSATPEFRAAVKGVPKPFIPTLTPLQTAARNAVMSCLPRGIERTAVALFAEIDQTLRDQQDKIENHEKWNEFRTHNAHMRAKLGALMQIVAPIVGETYSPTSTDRASELFIADRITSKICRLLAPGNIKSWDTSGETATGSVSPEPHSAEWYRQQSQSSQAHVVIPVTQEPPVVFPNSLTTDEEINELRFQNAELSRQLEAAQASEKQFREEIAQINNVLQPFREELFAAELTHVSIDQIVSRLVFAWNKYKAETCDYSKAIRAADACREHLADFCTREGIDPNIPVGEIVLKLTHWYRGAMVREGNLEHQVNTLSEEFKSISRALQPFTAIKTWGIGETMTGVVERLVEDWRTNKAERDNNIEAVQKERDELGELVSDIKLILAKHLADDPAINALGTVDLIDVKLASLRDASEKAYTLDSLKARLQQQVNRLLDFGLHDIQGVKGATDFVGVLHQLVSFRLGAESAQKQKDAKDSSSSSEASSTIAPKAVVHAPGSDAATKEKDDDSDIQLPATPNVIPPSHEEFLRGCGILALTKGKRHCIPKFLGLRYGENPANAHECMRELCLSGTEWANFRNAGERIVTYCADKNLVKGTAERKDFDRVLAEFCDKADSIDGVKPAKREPKDF